MPSRLSWSFANVSVTPSPPAGSTALDTEEQEGFIGQNTQRAPSPPASPPAPAPAPAPAPTQPAAPPGTTPAPTIASATVKAAPSGAANTRKDVGVGEVVDFTGSAAGTWKASAGTASGASSTTFRWTAPPTAGTVTVTLTVGGQSATDTITVVAPKTISMRNVRSHTSLLRAGGACMLTEVTFNPTDVCLGAIQWLEEPGPATGVTGYFKKFSAATLHHNPNTNYSLVNDKNIMEAGPNNGPNDHCATHSLPGTYSEGEFEWVIPNQYILDGEAASAGRHFADTRQRFTMSAAGTLTITKAGATT